VVAIEERSFETGAVTLNYAEAGTGAAVVLLHGGSARWQHLAHLVRELADRWHVYAPDLRGHGRSGHAPRRYRLTDYADDLIEFLDHHIGSADVFGHSLGAQIAIVAAARRPDLFRALAIGDTPLSISTLRPTLQQARPTLTVWRDLAASDRARNDIADALREMRVDFEGRSGRAGDLMAQNSSWFTFMADCLSDLDSTMLDAVIEFEEMHAGFEADRLLPEISCPVLLIQADPTHGGLLSDEDVDIAQALLRDVRVARIDQVGHSMYPWKIAATLRNFFLSV
jgi:pimeloyl-ACP methyl ester carboxylesterase